MHAIQTSFLYPSFFIQISLIENHINHQSPPCPTEENNINNNEERKREEFKKFIVVMLEHNALPIVNGGYNDVSLCQLQS